MQAFFAVVHNLVMLVGLFYIAQFVVGIFNWPARENNPIYRLFRFLTSPVTALARAMTPSAVQDNVCASGGLLPVVLALRNLDCRSALSQASGVVSIGDVAQHRVVMVPTAGTTLIAAVRAHLLRQVASWAILFRRTGFAPACYERALRDDPNDTATLAQRAYLFAQSVSAADRQRAVAEFERLVALKPADADSWFNLGFLHQQQVATSGDPCVRASRCTARRSGPCMVRPRAIKNRYGR